MATATLDRRHAPRRTVADTGAADGALLARVAAGDRGALADLYERHRAGVTGFVSGIVGGDRSLCEEVLQDTFVAVWRGAGAFEGRSAVRTWLYGIAKRQAYNKLRGKRFELTVLDDEVRPVAAGPTPEDAALAAADRRYVAALLSRLGPLQREILTLAFVDDLSYPEMAEILEIPVGTVKSRLSNAKVALGRLARAERGD